MISEHQWRLWLKRASEPRVAEAWKVARTLLEQDADGAPVIREATVEDLIPYAPCVIWEAGCWQFEGCILSWDPKTWKATVATPYDEVVTGGAPLVTGLHGSNTQHGCERAYALIGVARRPPEETP